MKEPQFNENSRFWEVQCVERGCATVFHLSESKARDLKERFGTLPKRCETHRKAKRERIALREVKINSPFFNLLPRSRQEEIKKGKV